MKNSYDTVISPDNADDAKNISREPIFSSQEEVNRFLIAELDKCADLGDVEDLFVNRLWKQRQAMADVSRQTKLHFLHRVAQLINIRNEGSANFWNDLADRVYGTWLYDCQEDIAHILHLSDVAMLEKNINYIQMIEKFYVHGYDYSQNYTKKFSHIAEKIRAEINDPQTIFFAGLIGADALRRITTDITPAYRAEPTAQDVQDREEEERLREEMGEEAFEKYMDDKSYENGRVIDHDPDYTALPFIIARQRFGYVAEKGLLISSEKDYVKLKKDYEAFNTWADREFFHPEGYDEDGRGWQDADEHAYEDGDGLYGGGMNEHAYDMAEQYLTRVIKNISIPMTSLDGIAASAEDVQAYTLLIAPHMQRFLQGRGFVTNNLSVQEQFYFLQYAKTVRNHEGDRLQAFVQKFGHNALRSFLSLEHGGADMGAKILRIGERYDHDVAAAIFAKYAEIIDVAERAETHVAQQFDDHATVNVRDISEKLLIDAKNLLVISADREDTVPSQEMIAALNRVNARVTLTAEIIAQLPRESVAHLDLAKLRDVERHIDLKAEDLRKMPELLAKMEAVVRDQFPAGDTVLFRNDCMSARNAGVTVTLANGEILSFFMKKKVGARLSELDWFSANPDAPIRGVGEATALLGFNHARDKEESYYAVAKPYVKSLSSLIELQGFVGFDGMTHDGEYKHHYMRARRLAREHPYAIKQLSPDQNHALLREMQGLCERGDTIYTLQHGDTRYDVARVSFFGLTHNDDLSATDERGWLYQEMRRQSLKGNVLARYIPASSAKDNTTYYAVFAPDHSTDEARRPVQDYVRSKVSHSA